MRIGICGIVLCAFAMSARGQALDLAGRVVQANGAPIPDATVELKARGVSTKTGADGSFALNANSSVGPDAAGPIEYRLEPDFLVVVARHPQDIRLEVVDGSGRLLGGLFLRLAGGSHRIALSEAVPVPGLDAGLYFLRIEAGGRTLTYPFLPAGQRMAGAVFGSAYRGKAASKRAAVADSLRIRKTGYKDLVLAVASYTAGSLGDLILTADSGGGGICARQRSERTSDGFEVVVCESLFEQPPRVRLPPPAASSEFAGMTREAFVTVAGGTYPHATPVLMGPEMIRHASALYEIKLRDGKVESFRPAIVFAESLFMAPLMGKAFEGLISARTGAARYAAEPTLPVRMHIMAEPYRGEPKTASSFPVKATLVNLAAPILAADGSCMPALSSHGSRAPFDPGAEVLILVSRIPSMHVFGDDELVFSLQTGSLSAGSLMSDIWFFTPLDIVEGKLTLTGTYSGTGHGTPGYIPTLDLHAVSGGGGACPAK